MTISQRNMMHLLGLLALVLAIVYLLMNYGGLPERVPTHFNAWGEADAWGGKATLWVLPAIGLFSWALLWFLRKADPKYMNTPVKLTPENRATQLRLGYNLLAWTNMLVSFLMAYIVWSTVKAAQSPDPARLGLWVYLLLAAVIGVVIWYTILARRHR